ncbi:hypothetical protein N1851_028682 [Merluccius polli]|uniref:Uncharacterized protein n=1 Tax=Merluccius polli TaxID=89951 RepID=A0AA47NRB6_MERPO|nr:hypothetical protein N1851_028682 [Merluccius polli]
MPLVLEALCQPPFEPLGNTAFLLAIASAKRVGELHSLSVSQACMSWNADGSGVALWLNPSFLPKRMSASHANQCIMLVAYDPTHLWGVPLGDICAAANWASPCTFARFYRVNVAAPHALNEVGAGFLVTSLVLAIKC